MNFRSNQYAQSIAHFTLIISVPIILTALSVRLVMSPAFLTFEYNRAGLPQDIYGFTREDRLEYAPPSIEYLLNNADISFLEDLRLPRDKVPIEVCIIAPESSDLCYMFNERELVHMEDVKNVTRSVYGVSVVVSVLAIISSIYLWNVNRVQVKSALFGGSILTLGIIASIVIIAITAWDLFFTAFHGIFFEGDSWLFRYSDTLIRLFPEQFWFDAAMVIGGLVLAGSVAIAWLTWKWSIKYTHGEEKS